MGRLQQTAQGLLSFLQLKDLGRNPSDLADVVAPTLDLTSWMMLNKWEVLRATIADFGAGIGFQTPANNFFAVPQTECWWVRSLNGEALMAAGNTMKWTMAKLGINGIISPYNPPITNAPADYGVQCSDFVSRDPWLIGPGEFLGFYVVLNTHAAAQAMNMQAQIVRMRI